MSSVPFQPGRLYEQIAQRIAASIDAGEFQVGERLPAERDLCKRYGVSRPSLREALIALEVDGLVEVRSGSGIYAAAPRKLRELPTFDGSTLGPFDVGQARLYLEPRIAEQAARHASDAQLAQIQGKLEALHACRVGSAGLIEADRQFHLAIADASGNPANGVMLDALWQHRTTPLYYQLENRLLSRAAWARAMAEHDAVMAALAARDPAAAAAAMQAHMLNAQRRMASKLD
jgi:DNA-binding FadR family transcriptional regulator